MFPFIFIAPAVAGYYKTASNFIIASHVITAVKENQRTKIGEDLNFDPFTMITCQLNRRFNDSTVS